MPQLGCSGTLDVVVTVDQDRRRRRVACAELANGKRVSVGNVHELATATGCANPVDHPSRRARDVTGVAPARRDRRHAEPIDQLIKQSWIHPAQPNFPARVEPACVMHPPSV